MDLNWRNILAIIVAIIIVIQIYQQYEMYCYKEPCHCLKDKK